MMAFLMDQAVRLLATKWKTPQLLAEELYSIFSADVPFTIDGPVTINNPSPLPGITINSSGLGDQAFQFNKQPSPIDFPGFEFPPGDGGIPGLPDMPGIPPLPEVPPPDFGNVSQVSIKSDGNTYITEGPADEPLPPPQVGGGGGGSGTVVLGRITDGSGTTYTMDVYGNGPTEAVTGSLIAVALGIDPGATLPVGTWLPIFAWGKSGHMASYIIPPVWL